MHQSQDKIGRLRLLPRSRVGRLVFAVLLSPILAMVPVWYTQSDESICFRSEKTDAPGMGHRLVFLHEIAGFYIFDFVPDPCRPWRGWRRGADDKPNPGSGDAF